MNKFTEWKQGKGKANDFMDLHINGRVTHHKHAYKTLKDCQKAGEEYFPGYMEFRVKELVTLWITQFRRIKAHV